ncbi:B3 domain-containing protein At3g25182 [Linum grandiflorum]
MQKKVTRTDISTHHKRLSIPPTKIANEFLTDAEKNELKEHKKIKIGYFVDPDMNVWDSDGVSFRRWNMDKGFIYNIIGDAWQQVLEKKQLAKQDLVAGDVVALWSFRTCSGKLCFALLTLERRPTAAEMMIEERPLQIMSPDIDLTLKL